MIRIRLEQSTGGFRPRSRIAGTIDWSSEGDELSGIDLRLIWYTRGKGTRDVQIVEAQSIPVRGQTGTTPFSFTAPNGPYSFSGRLVSLVWAIEAVGLPSRDAERLDIVIAPDGREILLPVELVSNKP